MNDITKEQEIKASAENKPYIRKASEAAAEIGQKQEQPESVSGLQRTEEEAGKGQHREETSAAASELIDQLLPPGEAAAENADERPENESVPEAISDTKAVEEKHPDISPKEEAAAKNAERKKKRPVRRRRASFTPADLIGWALDNLKIFLPILAVLVFGLIILFALTHKKTEPKAERSLQAIEDETIPVPINADLEMNADTDLNIFFMDYYKALAGYDEELLKQSNPSLMEEDLLRIQAISDYVDSYPQVDVYTKQGPVEGSYVAYVYTKVRFSGYANEVPGMQVIYVKKDENGKFYIAQNDEDVKIADYIKKISVQQDVIDLNNRVNKEYNDLLAADGDLEKFMDDLTVAVDAKIGNLLALKNGTAIGETVTSEEESTEPEAAPVMVEATESVYARTGDSVDTDVVAQIAPGTVYERLEVQENGWSRIRYEDKEVFVKSEFLKEVPQAAATEGQMPAGETGQTPSRVRVRETVNIRAQAGTDAEILGHAYPGTEFTVVEKGEEWTAVTYEDKTGYIKNTFLEF